MSSEKRKLAIIDGKSVFYRGYYAMPNLTTKEGTPTGGVFGFATMALEVIKRLKPDYVCVAWDKPKTNIRKRLEMYPEYKAGRKPPPPDFYEQIPVLHELLNAFGWPLYELDDYEADDIMGTLAVQAAKQDIEVMLVTSDLDMLQLIDPHIHVFALKKGLSNIELYSPESFEAKYHIRVDQFLDLKSLKGDSSDNIPGVPGIGEKGAIELLQQYDTLDGIYENVALLKDGMAKKLVAGKNLAYLSKKLGAIWTDAPITLDLSEVDGSKVDPLKIRELLQRLEFRTLVRHLPEVMHIQEEHEARNAFEHGWDVSRLPKNSIVDTNDSLLALTEDLKTSDQFVLYSRTAGAHGKKPELMLISPSPGRVFSLNFRSLSPQHVYEVLGPFFADEKIQKIGHDLKSTIQMCYELGFDLNGVAHDTQIAGFLVDPLQRDFSLTELAIRELDYEGAAFEECDTDEIIMRAPEIVTFITSLTEKQTDQLRAMPKVAELAKTIEWPVIPVLAAMEYEGIQLDAEYLHNFAVEIEDSISDLEQQIYGHADQEFNIASPAQLADILFVKLNLPTQGVKKGKTGYSTAANELDKLRGIHPIIDLVTQWREVTKLKNTYVDTLPTMVDETSRLHTTFNLTIAQTGRLSSTDPNLQNIPVRTDLGKRIRNAFVAAPGKVFVSADYSQFELRLAAYLAGDEELIDMFNAGADIHTTTAAQVYGRNPDEVTKQMRRDAKVINFGVLYGMSPHGLSIATGMTIAAAKTFIDKYFELRKPLLDYMNLLRERARTDGYVETLFGRRRPTPDIHSSNFVVRQAAERAAINMPIQGTEADLMKLAMIEIKTALDTNERWQDVQAFDKPKMLLQIHDSILVECLEEDATTISELLKETMENVYKLPVRLDVDVTTGNTWGEL